jgi:hypothetical protein
VQGGGGPHFFPQNMDLRRHEGRIERVTEDESKGILSTN